jgi:transcriptional regulator with XRE-family HTH domain
LRWPLRGMTLDEVAEGVLSSFGLISHYENGRKYPTEETVDALAELLGVRPSFFYVSPD